jgi:hypothetical protein
MVTQSLNNTSGNRMLMKLDVSDNSMFGKKDKTGITAWAAALKGCTSITALNLAKTGISAKDTKILAPAISNMGSISPVNLLMNDIGIGQADALVSILKGHPTLKSLCGNTGEETVLNMSGKMDCAADGSMDFAADGSMLVAEIVDNGALLHLDFSNNSIGGYYRIPRNEFSEFTSTPEGSE